MNELVLVSARKKESMYESPLGLWTPDWEWSRCNASTDLFPEAKVAARLSIAVNNNFFWAKGFLYSVGTFLSAITRFTGQWKTHPVLHDMEFPLPVDGKCRHVLLQFVSPYSRFFYLEKLRKPEAHIIVHTLRALPLHIVRSKVKKNELSVFCKMR